MSLFLPKKLLNDSHNNNFLFTLCIIFSAGAGFYIAGIYFRLDVLLLLLFIFANITTFDLRLSRFTIVEKLLLFMIGTLLIHVSQGAGLNIPRQGYFHDIFSCLFVFIVLATVRSIDVDFKKVLRYASILLTGFAFMASFHFSCYTPYNKNKYIRQNYIEPYSRNNCVNKTSAMSFLIENSMSKVCYAKGSDKVNSGESYVQKVSGLIGMYKKSHPAYYERFLFLSKNPNQTALLFLMLPFVIIYTGTRRSTTILLFSISVYLGYLTQSRALYFSWFISCFVYLFCHISPRLQRRTLYMFFASLGLIGFIAAITIVSLVVHKTLAGEIKQRYLILAQGLTLLKGSPVFGYGPGLHLIDKTAATETYIEAHNSFIDFTLEYGLIATIFYLYVVFGIMKRIYPQKQLFSLLTALLLYSIFHFTMRHPIYWILLFWIDREAVEARETNFNSKLIVLDEGRSVKYGS